MTCGRRSGRRCRTPAGSGSRTSSARWSRTSWPTPCSTARSSGSTAPSAWHPADPQGDDMDRTLYEADHEAFRETVRAFFAKEVVPHDAAWNAAGIVPREMFAQAAAQGLIGWAIPEEFGGGGVRDFRFNTVLIEEIHTAGTAGSGNGLSLVNDVCLPYFLDLATQEQKERWLPGIAAGELITAI